MLHMFYIFHLVFFIIYIQFFQEIVPKYKFCLTFFGHLYSFEWAKNIDECQCQSAEIKMNGDGLTIYTAQGKVNFPVNLFSRKP